MYFLFTSALHCMAKVTKYLINKKLNCKDSKLVFFLKQCMLCEIRIIYFSVFGVIFVHSAI